MEKTTHAELEALREANAFKDQLISIMAHDLRSPLNTIKGTLELLEGDMLTIEERKAILTGLQETVENTLLTLDNLLGWASQRAYAGMLGTKTKDEPLNIYGLAQRAIEYAGFHTKKKTVHIINSIPLDIYAIGDLEQVSFVLRNLISNAVKFSYPDQHVEVTAINKDDMVQVSVKDDGIGMPDSRIETLFQIATRSSDIGTHNEKGTGLGLIFCKEFVENNGGKIWVEQNDQKGLTFKFTIPRQN